MWPRQELGRWGQRRFPLEKQEEKTRTREAHWAPHPWVLKHPADCSEFWGLFPSSQPFISVVLQTQSCQLPRGSLTYRHLSIQPQPPGAFGLNLASVSGSLFLFLTFTFNMKPWPSTSKRLPNKWARHVFWEVTPDRPQLHMLWERDKWSRTTHQIFSNSILISSLLPFSNHWAWCRAVISVWIS